jgi:hypothetical protein
VSLPQKTGDSVPEEPPDEEPLDDEVVDEVLDEVEDVPPLDDVPPDEDDEVDEVELALVFDGPGPGLFPKVELPSEAKRSWFDAPPHAAATRAPRDPTQRAKKRDPDARASLARIGDEM